MIANINWLEFSWELVKGTLAWTFAIIKLVVITLGWKGWVIIILILFFGYLFSLAKKKI